MITKEQLKNYWWFRLIQVIYIILFIISIIIVVMLNNDKRPRLDTYSSTYYFRCYDDNGLRGNISGEDRYAYNNNTEIVYRFMCSNERVLNNKLESGEFLKLYNEAKSQNLIPKLNNFEYVIKDEIYTGSWQNYIGYLILSLVGDIIFWIIIKFIFLYILIGKDVFNSIRKKTNSIFHSKF
jgi:hypothetical protein